MTGYSRNTLPLTGVRFHLILTLDGPREYLVTDEAPGH
jgi:hypothetical protein